MKAFSFIGIFLLIFFGCQCKNMAKKSDSTTENNTTSVKTTVNTTDNIENISQEKEKTHKLDKNGMLYLREGENVFLEDAQMNVTFRKTLEDSRCPINARCIWAGVATVEVIFMGTYTRPAKIKINTIDDEQKDYHQTVQFNGYSITLDDISPAVTTDKGFNELKGSYKIRLRFAKGTPVNLQKK